MYLPYLRSGVVKMKNHVFSWLAAGLLLMAAAASAGPHHHCHWRGGFHGYHAYPRFGLYLGLPVYPRPYFSYPYYPYYPPSIVTVPSSPPVYIERPAPPVQQQFPAGYWYYCNNPEGYYPYVADCPAGWRQVDPIPQR